MELILTRHGETLENRQDIMQGHMPGTLSPLGIQQAEQLADLLTNEPIDVIVSSDLARSFDTAKAVAVRRSLEPQPTALLREIDWGKYTGGRLKTMDWHNLPQGCESLDSLMQRAEKFIGYIREKYAGQNVLAVGHGAINRAIVACLEGKQAVDMIDMPIMKNTSVLKFAL